MARQPLGRGLSALLGEDTVLPSNNSGTLEIDVDMIEPNPEQPRSRFTEVNLEELARSIASNGIVQPIVVRKKGAHFQIVAGERRWRAAQRAGVRKIPAVIRAIPDEKLLELALIENIQRQELNPLEEARAYRKLMDTVGLTQEMVAERVGKERTLIATSLRLLKLPADVQGLIEDGSLSAGHGRALLMAESPADQRKLAETVVKAGLSVRETERAVKRQAERLRQPIENKAVRRTIDANLKAAQTKLMRHLNTAVRIVPGKKGNGGKIEIEYYGMEDLDRIYQFIIDKQRS